MMRIVTMENRERKRVKFYALFIIDLYFLEWVKIERMKFNNAENTLIPAIRKGIAL
jgi:hypothetical protein